MDSKPRSKTSRSMRRMRSNSPTGVIPISAMKAPTRSDRKISLTRTAPGEPPRNRCRFAFIPGTVARRAGSERLGSGGGRAQRRADLRGGDHRLGPALDPELLQDRRDMRLDGRLRDAELVGDLLVEEPLGQHHQDPALLRRQGREPPHYLGRLLVLG